jgi:UDPglucose 6-dehydrogenase
MLPDEPNVDVRPTILEACKGADGVVIATEWPEFVDIELAALRRVTRGDLLFDGRDLISPSRAVAAGFRYQGLAGFGD